MADYSPTKTARTSQGTAMIGISGIYWAPRGVIAANTAWQQIAEVLEGSGSIGQDAPTFTDINVEEKDIPFKTIPGSKASPSFTADIPDLSKDIVKFLMDAEDDVAFDNILNVPDDSNVKYGMFMLIPNDGVGVIFTNAVMTCTITGANSKTETCNLHIEVRAQAGGGTGFEASALKFIYPGA